MTEKRRQIIKRNYPPVNNILIQFRIMMHLK